MDYFSMYKAWQKCRRRKRATPQAQFYEVYLLDNLIETVQALRSGCWRPRRPVCFMVDKPKAREIHAAHYSDRVVHHWLVPGLEELYEPVFIHDVYSNRKDKGTHMAVKRLQHFMRSVSRGREDHSDSTWEPGRNAFQSSFEEGRLKNSYSLVSTESRRMGQVSEDSEARRAHHDCVQGIDGHSLQAFAHPTSIYTSGFCHGLRDTTCIRDNDVVGNACSPAGAGSYGIIDIAVGACPCGRTVRNPAGGFFLQLDIKNFFNSVDRRILFSLLQKRLYKAVRHGKVDESTAVSYRDISHIILKQDVGKEAFMAATPAELARIPAYKRLINAGQDKGLPIGNLTSQFFANVYLNELDQFVKHQLKCHSYLRYVDDFILLHRDPDQLRRWHREIENFLMERLGLELKQPIILQPIRQGANFLGYIVRPDYLLVRQRVIGNLWEKLIRFEKQWIKGDAQQGWVLTLLLEPREHLRSVLASYWGHFSHADHYRLARKVFTRFPWLSCLFELRNDHFVPLWQPETVTGYKSQQRFFQRRFPRAEIRIQRGCQYDKVSGVSGSPATQVGQSFEMFMRSSSCRSGFNPTLVLPCPPVVGLKPDLQFVAGSHAQYGNPSVPASQALDHHEKAVSMSQKRVATHPGRIPKRRMGTRSERIVGNVCSPAGAGSYGMIDITGKLVGARPCGRTGLPQSTDQNSQLNPRLAVSKVIVRQQGYLKGGLRRRCIESLTFLPSSQTGVSLCASFAP